MGATKTSSLEELRAHIEERRTMLVNSMLGGVSVSGGKESEVLMIRYVSADPEHAAAAANAMSGA